jgi:hypothetical protein
VPQLSCQKSLDGGPDPIHDRSQVAGLIGGRTLQLLERGYHRAALGVPQDDNQPRVEPSSRELDTTNLRRGHDVTGDPDDEQVSQALIEYDLCWNPRIRTAEDDSERLLAGGERGALRGAQQGLGASSGGGESEISLSEPLDRLTGWNH